MDLDADDVQKHAQTLVDLLRQRAALQGDREAFTYVVDGEETSLTYGDLDRWARAIGAQIQEKTVPGDRAVILCQPGLEYVAALYGCLYAGLVAVPFYPPRPDQSHGFLESTLATVGASVALTTAAISTMDYLPDRIPALRGVTWQIVDRTEDGVEGTWQEPDITEDSAAYLLLTSGSTSEPKAVVRSHAAVMNGMAVTCPHAGLTRHSKFVSWIPMHSAFGIHIAALMPLYGGFRAILMAPGAVLERPFRWLQTISRAGATHSAGSNFAYDLVARTTPPDIRGTLDLSSWECAWNGGEQVRADTLSLFASVFAPCGFRREALRPSYGMTEVMMVSGALAGPPATVRFDTKALAQNRVVRASAEAEGQVRVSCGTPIAGQPVVIVNPTTLRLCSPNEVGEIWVTGPSVAQGYWNQPEETEKTFRAHLPTGEGPFLRTGDLGLLYEGELFLTGRLKELIIIRGRNLYPQDIERTAEASHPALVDNSGAAFSVDTGQDERLVVVYEVKGSGEDVREVVGAIRRAVTEQHDVQAYAVVLIAPGSMPKTESGKIQRAECRAAYQNGRLSALYESVLAARERPQLKAPYAPARTAAEAVLVAIWEAVLGIDGIGIHDHFAELGGDSLLSMQVLARANHAGLGLAAGQLARAPTVAELAELVGHAASVDAEQGTVSGPAPLTPRQHLAFETPDRPKIESFIVPLAVELPADADPATVERAVRAVVEHHDALRMRFPRAGDQWIQINAAQEDHDIFSVVDISPLPKSDRQMAIRAAIAERHRAIDLADGPLVQAVLVRRGPDSSSLLFMPVHHFVTDAASSSILLEDLLTAYRQLEQEQAVALPPKTTSVKTWAERLAGYAQSLQAKDELDYWLSALPAHNPAPLPREEPFEASALGTDDAVTVELGREETGALLRELPRSMGAQMNEAVIAALVKAFQSWTGSSALYLNLVVHGRTPLFEDVDLSRTVGWFAAMFPVLVSVEAASSVEGELASVTEELREVPNGGVGFGALRYLSKDPAIARELQTLAVPEVKLNYQGQLHGASPGFGPRVAESQLLKEFLTREVHLAHRDMEIQARVQGGTLRLLFLFHRDVHSRSAIERLAKGTITALQRIVAECRVHQPAAAGT